MPSVDALETLQQINGNLRCALLRLHPERRHCSTIKPQDFSNIVNQLLGAAKCLRRKAADSPAAATMATAFEKEMLEYRSMLERLKHFLPDLHVRLLAERSRIETARAHAAATATWAQARNKTL
jgi:hypothetical protein